MVNQSKATLKKQIRRKKLRDESLKNLTILRKRETPGKKPCFFLEATCRFLVVKDERGGKF